MSSLGEEENMSISGVGDEVDGGFRVVTSAAVSTETPDVAPPGDAHRMSIQSCSLTFDDYNKFYEKVGKFDYFVLVFSICSYAADVSTDLWVASKYSEKGHVWWFALTLSLVLVPSVVMQLVSFAWFLEDDVPLTWWEIILHIVQLGPILRYVKAFVLGVQDRRTLSYAQMRDASMIRLLEAFFESAPQLVLQLYIMASENEADAITVISVCLSLISLSWAIGAYAKALRAVRLDRQGLSLRGVWIQCIWRTGMAMSRVVALALFATAYKAWLFLAVCFHWLIMTGWLIAQKTEFCPGGSHLEWTFDGMVAVVLIFCFFNTKDGKIRNRVIAYYILMLVENSVLIYLWYVNWDEDVWYNIPALAAVWGGFILGLVFMFIYYRFFHPTVAVDNKCKPKSKRELNYVISSDDYVLERSNNGDIQSTISRTEIFVSTGGCDTIDGREARRRSSQQRLLLSVPPIMKRHRFPPELSKPAATKWSSGTLPVPHTIEQPVTSV